MFIFVKVVLCGWCTRQGWTTNEIQRKEGGAADENHPRRLLLLPPPADSLYLYLPHLTTPISNMSKKPGSTVSKKFINNPDHVVQEMLEVRNINTAVRRVRCEQRVAVYHRLEANPKSRASSAERTAREALEQCRVKQILELI